MEHLEKLEKAYQALKQIKAAVVKQHFNNKMDLPLAIGSNILTGNINWYCIPYQYCKTKIGAQKYVNNLINDESTKLNEIDEIDEIFNQLQKMQETQNKIQDTLDRGFKLLNTKMQWTKN